MDATREGRVDWVEFVRMFGDATLEHVEGCARLTGIFREHGVDLNRTFGRSTDTVMGES